jgi:agmatine/peptidylarginine deiminase
MTYKRTMKAIWSDDSYSSLSNKEEYMANMCFMEIKSKNKVQSSNDESNPTYEKLHDALEYLYDEIKKSGSKYSILKKNYACLLVEKKIFEKERLHCN